jgi:hypothetical protein
LVLIRVGRSFRASTWQMVTKIYLPAMRLPIINGVRLGLGVAIIGTLLAETKLSNKGVGFLIINAYSTFNMPRMYALLIVLFVLSIGVNALIGRLGGVSTIRRARQNGPSVPITAQLTPQHRGCYHGGGIRAAVARGRTRSHPAPARRWESGDAKRGG